MTPEEKQKEAHQKYREAQRGGDSSALEKAGKQLRDATLERADRREWAHTRRGDESRWRE